MKRKQIKMGDSKERAETDIKNPKKHAVALSKSLNTANGKRQKHPIKVREGREEGGRMNTGRARCSKFIKEASPGKKKRLSSGGRGQVRRKFKFTRDRRRKKKKARNPAKQLAKGQRRTISKTTQEKKITRRRFTVQKNQWRH